MTIGTLSFSVNYFNSRMRPDIFLFRLMLVDTLKNSELFQNSKKKSGKEEGTDAGNCR